MVTIKVSNETVTMSEKEFDSLIFLFDLAEEAKKEDGYKHVFHAREINDVSLEYWSGDYFLEVGNNVKENV